MRRTHTLGGAALWLGVCAVLPVPPVAVVAGVPVAAWSALWPDWDHPQASMARTLGPVTYHLSRWVERRFGGHRAGTHSLLVGVPLCGLLGALAGLAVGWGAVTLSGASTAVLWPLVAVCGAASYVGALSHVLLDFVTCNCGGCDWKPRRLEWSGRHRAGCEILWPWVRRRFGVPALAVGSSTEDGFRRFVLPAVAALAAAGALVGW